MTKTKAPEVGLKFYPASHRYKLDGQWVPGVTTILGKAIPKPALTKWAAKSVAEFVAYNPDTVQNLWAAGDRAAIAALKEVPWQSRDDAAARGTEVHDLAERYLKGEEIHVPDAILGHVESCAQFISDWQIQPILIEETVGSRQHKYAGKLDLVADSKYAPTAIFDWKTTKSGIYFETAFQLNAYAHADFYGEDGNETPMNTVGIQDAYAVHIRADGYEVVPMEFGPHVFEEFLHLLASTQIIKRAEGDWKVPGTGYRKVGLDGNGEPNE